MNHKLSDYLHNPYLVFNWLAAKHLMDWMDDKTYLKLKYRASLGKKLNLENPQTFNEKLQWLKLYNRKPEYTVMVDKVKAKEYVANIIGEEHIIPTLGVWDNPDDIDFDKLPNQFVLKCNHNSGLGMCICRDKSKLDIEKVKRELRKGLKQNYYLHGREWPYKDVPRKILAEKFMVDESGTELKDYKIFCMDGEPEIIEVDYGRFSKHMRNMYDKTWDLMEMEFNYPSDASHVIDRPEKLNEMLELARKLSKDIPYVRTDFYSIGEKLYWGELTFFNEAGMGAFRPEEWDERLGKLVVLPPHVLSRISLSTKAFACSYVSRISRRMQKKSKISTTTNSFALAVNRRSCLSPVTGREKSVSTISTWTSIISLCSREDRIIRAA